LYKYGIILSVFSVIEQPKDLDEAEKMGDVKFSPDLSQHNDVCKGGVGGPGGAGDACNL
jgi:hypothetical protein